MKLIVAGGSESEADSLSRSLSGSGYATHRVRTSEELFGALDEGGAGAVFLFDGSGIETLAAARRIAGSGYPIPLIAVCGSLGEEAAVRLLKAGVANIVHKDRLEEAGSVLESELELARERAEHIRVGNAVQTVANEWRTAVDTVRSPICLLDIRGRIVRCNKAFRDLAGKTFPELIGSRYDETLGGVQYSGERLVFGGLDASMGERVFLAAKNGRTFEVHAVPVKDGAGNESGYVHVMNDITERVRAEETQARMQEHLARAQKLEAVGQLAGGIAHDFNNLLTGIIGYCSVLLSRLASEDRSHAFVSKIEAAARRAAELTQGLLTFARRQPFRPRRMDLNAVVAANRDFMEQVAGKTIGIKIELCPSPLPVFVDPAQMQQVLLNLSTNARDAMAGEGTITIRTVPDPSEADHPLACIVFSDTGGGMNPETMGHIFEPFFSTKETGKGTGLGLSIVWSIVKQHGGETAVDSIEGRGTSFRISLPMGGGAGGKETILLVDDDETMRNMTCAILEGLGYAVLCAADGEEAIAKFKPNAGTVSLAILDVVMPKRDGISVLEDLRGEKRDLKAVFISGYVDEVRAEKGERIGRDGFLRKPFTPLALACMVREVLDGRRT